MDYDSNLAAEGAINDLRVKLNARQSQQKLKVAIVTENFLPKIDGVTRTLARLLEHLRDEGHEALVLGPATTVTEYAGHKVVGTKGIPLLVYPDLKLNFFRPLFIRKLLEFKPDVIHFVDPIWLGAQTLPAVSHFLPDVGVVSSYHTNLAMYASLFGWGFLTPTMWKVQRYLHGRCSLTFCPSPSTKQMLETQGFNNVRLWSRGVDTNIFNTGRRSDDLRRTWGVGAPPAADSHEGHVATAALLLGQSLGAPASAQSSKKAFKAAAKDEEIVVMYVGRMSWEKNLRLLVESFRGLEKAEAGRPACKLVFVGDGPAMGDIQQLCDSYGLNATFMGHRKGTELASCFASADIFAFPSWTETFGQVVLESLASGLPVVGLKAEGVRDLVQDHVSGRLLDLDTLAGDSRSQTAIHELFQLGTPVFKRAVEQYHGLIKEVASDKSKRLAMSAAALESAKMRSWHEAMSRIVDGYSQVAQAARERRDAREKEDGSDADTIKGSPTLNSPPILSPSSSFSTQGSLSTWGSFTSMPSAFSSRTNLGSPTIADSPDFSPQLLGNRRGNEDVEPLGLGYSEAQLVSATGRQLRQIPSRKTSTLSFDYNWPSGASTREGSDLESISDAGQEVQSYLPADLASRKGLAAGSSFFGRFWVIFYMLWTLFSWVATNPQRFATSQGGITYSFDQI